MGEVGTACVGGEANVCCWSSRQWAAQALGIAAGQIAQGRFAFGRQGKHMQRALHGERWRIFRRLQRRLLKNDMGVGAAESE